MPSYSDDDEYAYSRRRSVARSASLMPRAPEVPAEHINGVYVERRQGVQDPYYPPIHEVTYYEEYERPRGRSMSSARSSRRRQSTRYDDSYEEESGYSPRSFSKHHSNSRSPSPHVCRSESDNSFNEFEEHTLEDEEKMRKKLRNKEILAATLATISTAAAAGTIYQTVEDQKERRRQLRRGQLCAAEAKFQKNKAIALDIFSVGVAAIGVHSAISGWKKMQEQRNHTIETHQKIAEVKERRQSRMLEGSDTWSEPDRYHESTIAWNGHGGEHAR